MKKAILTFLVIFTSCGLIDSSQSIVGKWKGKNVEDGIMIFKKNGEFDILDKSGISAFGDKTKISIKYEAITEVEPNQLYIIFTDENKSHRAPLGIFKIENRKLILREAIEFHRTVGGFDMGVSRYEMPKDFSGVIKIFEKT